MGTKAFSQFVRITTCVDKLLQYLCLLDRKQCSLKLQTEPHIVSVIVAACWFLGANGI